MSREEVPFREVWVGKMTAPKRIQIVEDEAVIAMEMTQRLQGFGYDVVGTAVSCEQALVLAQREKPDLILMDIQIKGNADGIETAQRIRQTMDVPILFMTAYSDEATLGRAMEAAPYGYLIKPYRPDELRTTIRVVMHKHETEIRLRQSEYWFSRTLQCLNEGIIVTEADGTVRFMNEVAERLTERPLEQAVGHGVGEMFFLADPESRQQLDNPLLLALASGEQTYEAKGELPLMQGARHTYVEAGASLIREKNGALLGGVLVFRDSTRQKIAEEQLQMYGSYLEQMVQQRTVELERANAVKTQFLSAMSHELRTPMNAIMGFSQVLEAEPLTVEQSAYVGYIIESSSHLMRLIADLLDLRGIESGELEVKLQPVVLIDAIKYALMLLNDKIKSKDINLVINIQGQITLQADPIRLRQVLTKLISNAVVYNREHGSVEISAAGVGNGTVRVAVRDTGIGIGPADQERIFRPFERLGALNVGSEGTGNGLALSKRLVELMRGKIGFSSAQGQGTTFWFELSESESINSH